MYLVSLIIKTVKLSHEIT